MTVTWTCLTCPASGEGDRDAERHTKDTQHGTTTMTAAWTTREDT